MTTYGLRGFGIIPIISANFTTLTAKFKFRFRYSWFRPTRLVNRGYRLDGRIGHRTQWSPYKYTIRGRANHLLNRFYYGDCDPLCSTSTYSITFQLQDCHSPSPCTGMEASRDLTSSSRISLNVSAIFRVNFERIISV